MRHKFPFTATQNLSGLITIGITLCTIIACNVSDKTTDNYTQTWLDPLADTLQAMVRQVPGQVGVAVIYDNTDTLVVNNSVDYPLMSMFKLHEALGVCHTLDKKGTGLDTIMNIDAATLDPETWSPMLKEHTGAEFSLTAAELLEYILVQSDNNASNLLFDKIVSVGQADSIIRALTGISDFAMRHTEHQMKADHTRSYDNRTSPLAYAVLVNRLFTDSIVSPEKQAFVKHAMLKCDTGLDRLSAPLAGKPGVTFAHRTGSGYTNPKGEITAVNDGGYVTLPDGKGYSIAVFVKDYAGPQAEADSVIAAISQTVFDHIMGKTSTASGDLRSTKMKKN